MAYLLTTAPVIAGDTAVIPPETFVQGQIARITIPGVGRDGELQIRSAHMVFANGYTVAIPHDFVVPLPRQWIVPEAPGPGKAAGLIATLAAPTVGALIGGLTSQHSPPPLTLPVPGQPYTLPDPGKPAKGAAIGAGIGFAVTVPVAIALLRHHHDFFVEAGSPGEMILEQPLMLAADRIAAAVPRQGTVAAVLPSGPPALRTCYTADIPGTPDIAIPGTPGTRAHRASISQARRETGFQVRDNIADQGIGASMTTLSQDLRYAIRMFVKSPGFAAIAVLTLALGIGANTALFSIVNGVLLNPLPYPHSEQLVAVYGKAPGVNQGPASYLNFLDWRRQTQTFSSMAIYRNQDYNFTGTSEGERLSGYMISADFFSTLGVNPILGRTFTAEEDQVGAAPAVVLGGGLWKRKFGSSPDIVGKSLTLNGTSYTVVGVVPSSFTFYGDDRDVYTAIGRWNDPSFRDRRISVSARVVGRLKPGVTLAQAQADMDLVARNLAAAFPVADKDTGISLVSMKDDIVGNVRPVLLVLLAAVGFLLLIACANVANLLLARALGRSREFALRAALGARPTRVIRQLLTESILLAGLGGTLGLLLAFFGTKAVLNALPGTLPRGQEISIDGRVLLFTMALSLFAAIVFGLAPALKSAQVNLLEVLKESGRGSSGARHRLQGVFVATEVAMALVLLIGAGLMFRTLAALWRVNPGYDPGHAITFVVSMPSSPATTSAETRARLRQFDDAMRSVPGVQAVSVTLGSRPMIHDSSLPFWIVGRPKPANDNDMPQAMFYLAEAGFQQAMGIILERGRFITPQDNENSPAVIDIDDVFARTYFPGEDPIGKRVHLEQFNVEAEIVGVVGHVKQWGPGADETSAIGAQFYYPFMQIPEKLMPMVAGSVAVVLRTQGDPAALVGPVRRAVAQMDPRQVVYGVQTMDGIIARSFAARRLSMILLAAFAALALVLSCVGIYGVISYLVSQRTREIGVRMALGAQRGDVMRLVLGQGARMAAVGVAMGVAGALGLTRLMANQLFGVTAQDPLTFAAVAILLTLVALLACYLPARRAVRVDVIQALRAE